MLVVFYILTHSCFQAHLISTLFNTLTCSLESVKSVWTIYHLKCSHGDSGGREQEQEPWTPPKFSKLRCLFFMDFGALPPLVRIREVIRSLECRMSVSFGRTLVIKQMTEYWIGGLLFAFHMKKNWWWKWHWCKQSIGVTLCYFLCY